MPFADLVQIETKNAKDNKVKSLTGRKKLGCGFCPLNDVKGINKIFGKVKGKKIFVWAQSPGPQENREKKELIGPSGKFLWHELERVGITRHDCDIQNVVRCLPATHQKNIYPSLQMRSPSKEEIKCCSIYNEQALEKSKASLHLVFGQIAANSLLGAEYKKDKRVFFSEKLKAWVVCLDHPSFFVRQGYSAGDNKQPNAYLIRFRSDLKHAKDLLARKNNDRFYFIKHLDSRGIVTRKDAMKAYRRLKREGEAGNRLIFDTEEGFIDKHGNPDDHGKEVLLCVGAQTKEISYTFIIDHPHKKVSTKCRQLNRKLIRKLLRNPKIEKSAHYSTHDTEVTEKFLRVEAKSMVYDSLIGEFFFDPNAKAYGLAAIAERRFPDYMGYKDIKYPDGFTLDYRAQLEGKKVDVSQQVDKAEKINKINLARLPWEKMVWYNGADCHLEKLVDDSTKDNVNMHLMGIYIDAGRVLSRMQQDRDCLPVFDYKWAHKVKPLFKSRKNSYFSNLRKLLGGKYIKYHKNGNVLKKKFNPNSPEQMTALVYDIVRARPLNDSRDTRHNTIKLLSIKYPKLRNVGNYREADKALTMLQSYKNCADLNKRRLRTIWKLTGTSTGRMSSGKTKERSNDAVINFQNVHGDPFIKNTFVSDRAWWEVYEYWLAHGDFDEKSWRKFATTEVMLGADFSQMELRVLAQKCGDKNLIKMFSSGKDPHVEVGHALTGWPKEVIAKDERRRKLIKNMQFGLVYGLSGEGLYRFIIAQGVETTLDEVNKYHRKYFQKFKGVKLMHESDRAFAEKHGYCQTMFGFKRKLNIQEQKEMGGDYEGAYWGNQAINSPVQGSAHQLLLMAVATLKRKKHTYHLLQKPMMEVHDSIYFRVMLKHLIAAAKQAIPLLTVEPIKIVKKEFKIKWKVPLVAKPKAGYRFGVQVENLKNEWEFLNAWCRENKKLFEAYKWCKKHQKSHDEYMEYQYSKKAAKAN